ncbi:MAG: trypsin-like serine protease [Candidatus Limnocylindria bacterium]
MRRITTLAVVALLLVTASSASAITHGESDGESHPYVGFAWLDNGALCSGTLLSPTVFLTAGHCTAGASMAVVWFTPFVAFPPTLTGSVFGTPSTHPDYDAATAFPDVGVVVLWTPVVLDTYASLPVPGILAEARKPVKLVTVGYGLQDPDQSILPGLERRKASRQLVEMSSALTGGFYFRATSAPGKGTGDGQTAAGGACHGDSGGPALLAGTHTIVGITSFALNGSCSGGDYSFRVDIPMAQDFIRSFLD